MTDLFMELKSYLWTVFLAFLGWVWWSFKKRFVPREDFDSALTRLEGLEVKVGTMPTANELRSLKDALGEVKGELRVFNERHINSENDRQRQERQLNRIEQYLMSDRK